MKTHKILYWPLLYNFIWKIHLETEVSHDFVSVGGTGEWARAIGPRAWERLHRNYSRNLKESSQNYPIREKFSLLRELRKKPDTS